MNSEFIISGGACHQMELAFRRNDLGSDVFNYLLAGCHLRAVDDLREGRLPKYWIDEEDNTHLILVSSGREHSWWEQNPNEAGFGVSPSAKQVLNNLDSSVRENAAYHVVIRPGYRMLMKKEVTNIPLPEYAHRRGWKLLNREACYLIANHPISKSLADNPNLNGYSLTDRCHMITHPDGSSSVAQVVISKWARGVEMGAHGYVDSSLEWWHNTWGFAFIVPWA